MKIILNVNLYLTTLGWTATIVWQRCHIDNLYHLNACAMHGTDGRLTSITRTFNISLDLTKTKIIGNLSAILTDKIGLFG